MPKIDTSLQSDYREISEATRAFFYSLLDHTTSGSALIPPLIHNSLCGSCSRIPFDEVFCTEDNETNLTMDIGTFSEIESRRDCAFCSFVRNICLVALPWHWIRRFQNYPEQFKLIGGPGAWGRFLEIPPPGMISPCAMLQAPDFSHDDKEYHQRFLSPWLLCYAPPQRTSLSVRLRTKGEVINGEIDVDLIKSWISKCTTNHELCQRKVSIPERHAHVRPRFIDVITENIVPGNKVIDYVALSYVRGPSELEHCKPLETKEELVISNLPNGNPPIWTARNLQHLVFSHPCQVVKDTMMLVKKLGYRYLWVDEYCIGSGVRERKIHISQMDCIYEGASLTICALSGAHRNSGLPGISSPLQVPAQPYVDLDSKRIIATRLPGFLKDADSSPWNERAWTFQEASLSRRLLCFTDLSVFWICKEKTFHDAIHCEDIRLPQDLANFPFHLDEFNNRFDMSVFRDMLLSYTEKHLTKDSDALPAISGLLSRISKITGEEFCFGQSKGEFVQSLMWKSTSRRRRKEFPSWTWLGWKDQTRLVIWRENFLEDFVSNIFLIDIDAAKRNMHYVAEKSTAKVIQYPDEKSKNPVLKITSQVARLGAFKVLPKGQYAQDSDGGEEGTNPANDILWCLSIPHSPISPCSHAGIGWIFADSSCFMVDPITSRRLERAGRQMEFMLLVHWQEHIKVKDEDWVALETNHLLTKRNTEVGDLVVALLLLRNPDGTAERVALVPIPYKSWIATSPEEMVVELV